MRYTGHCIKCSKDFAIQVLADATSSHVHEMQFPCPDPKCLGEVYVWRQEDE